MKGKASANSFSLITRFSVYFVKFSYNAEECQGS
jgi:hypothetical protein